MTPEPLPEQGLATVLPAHQVRDHAGTSLYSVPANSHNLRSKRSQRDLFPQSSQYAGTHKFAYLYFLNEKPYDHWADSSSVLLLSFCKLVLFALARTANTSRFTVLVCCAINTAITKLPCDSKTQLSVVELISTNGASI